jgi:hypothetical protein
VLHDRNRYDCGVPSPAAALRPLSLALPLLLAAAPFAVGSSAAAQQPLLQARASEARWLLPIAAALEVATPADLDARTPALLVVAADGTASLRAQTATAGAPMLELTVRPGAWLQQLGERGRELPGVWRNQLSGVARLSGVPVRPVLDAADGLLGCVRDLELATATVRAAADGKPASVHVALQPRSGSPLATWCAGLQPAATAAPAWPTTWAFAQLRLQLASERLAPTLAPLLPLLAAVADLPADELATRAGWFDGRFALGLGDEQLGFAFGLRAPQEFAALLKARAEREPSGDVTTTRKPAPAYRDIALLQTITESRTPLPRYTDADGALHAIGGLVGTTWLHTIGPNARPAIERAVDDALAGRMQPATASGSWLQVDVDLVRLRPFLGADGADGGGVRHVAITGRTTTNAVPTLHFDAELR